jgi:hypothetical protein
MYLMGMTRVHRYAVHSGPKFLGPNKVTLCLCLYIILWSPLVASLWTSRQTNVIPVVIQSSELAYLGS